MNLRDQVVEMIATVDPSEIGLLLAFQEAIIETQADYYYKRLIELNLIEE